MGDSHQGSQSHWNLVSMATEGYTTMQLQVDIKIKLL